MEDFADAFSSLVDLSLEGPDQTEEQAEEQVFPVRVRGCPASSRRATMWMLRWKCTRHSSTIDDRLAVCAAITRSLRLQSSADQAEKPALSFECEVQNLRLAVLDAKARKSEVELFIFFANEFHAQLKQSRATQVFAVHSNLQVLVQDFTALTMSTLTECEGLSIVHTASLPSFVDQAIAIECQSWNWNLSSDTILPFHFGVKCFTQDMMDVAKRTDDILAADTVPNIVENERGLQYVFVNCVGQEVWFGQYGTAEVLSIKPGASVDYSWRVNEAYLQPQGEDTALLEPLFGEAIYDELLHRHDQAVGFEALVRFALESPRVQGQPGTWSKPVSIDTLGVHKRTLIYASVSKNTQSVFFGNEPCTNLWISSQRGENGLQTVIHLLPSHTVVNYTPMPFEIEFACVTKSLGKCSDRFLNDIVQACPETQLEPEERHEEVIDAELRLDEPVGYIDEQELDFQFSDGPGTLGLMCPDPSLLSALRDDKDPTPPSELTIRIRAGELCEWSSVISVVNTEMYAGGKPTLVQVPGAPGAGSVWLWINIRSVYIRSKLGPKVEAWSMVQLWPTSYFLNDAPWPIFCRVRPQNRLEQLDYALTKRTCDFSEGEWPSAAGTRSKKDVQSPKGQPSLPRGNQESRALAAAFLKGESTPIANVRHVTASGFDFESGHAEVWRVEAESICPIFLDPRVEQVLLLSKERPEEDDRWSEPPLRVQHELFRKAFCINKPSCLLVHRVLHFENDEMVLEARRLRGFASLFVRLIPPFEIVNHTNRTIYIQGTGESQAVKVESRSHLCWGVDTITGFCVAFENKVWSCEVVFTNSEHIIAVPLDGDWVVQLVVNIHKGVSTKIEFSNRVLLHNMTEFDLDFVSSNSMFAEEELRESTTLRSKTSLGVASYFSEQETEKPNRSSGWIFSTTATAENEDPAEGIRLMSTTFRVAGVGRKQWSQLVLVPTAVNRQHSWKQYVIIETGDMMGECFVFVGQERDGVVHVEVHRECQPDCVFTNSLEQSICVKVVQSGWARTNQNVLVVPAGFCVAMNWIILHQVDMEICEHQEEGGGDVAMKKVGLCFVEANPDPKAFVNEFAPGKVGHFAMLFGFKDSHVGFVSNDDIQWSCRPIWSAEETRSFSMGESNQKIRSRRTFAWWEIELFTGEYEERTLATKSSLRVLLSVKDFQLSLFDGFYETTHLWADSVEFVFLNALSDVDSLISEVYEKTMVARCRDLQLDSYVLESEVPVAFYFLKDEDEELQEQEFEQFMFDDPGSFAPRAVRDRLLFGVRWAERGPAEKRAFPTQCLAVNVRVAPLSVAIEDTLLQRLAAVLTPIFATVVAQQALFSVEGEEEGEYNDDGEDRFYGRLLQSRRSDSRQFRMFVKTLRISDLEIVSTVRTTTMPMFLGIDRTPIRFSEVKLDNLFETAFEMRKDLLATYIADALFGSPAVLASLEIFGNPAGFVRSVGAGVYDLFFMPLRAIRHGHGPGGILRGVARGWSSLLLHFSEGALMSVSGFSSSVARNLDRLSMDPNYAEQREVMRRRRTISSSRGKKVSEQEYILVDRRNYHRRVSSYREMEEQEVDQEQASRFGTAKGIARGFLGLGQGFVGGATGIVTQPLESGSQGGWGVGSVLKGVGKGLVGVVTKPIGGAADLIAQTSGGIMQEAHIGTAAGPRMMRKRKRMEAIPHQALRLEWKVFPGGEVCIFTKRVRLDKDIVELVLSNRHIWFFSTYDGRGAADVTTVGCYKWSDIESLEESFREPTRLVLHIRHQNPVLVYFSSKSD
eukprot:CAMPEP_0203750646 /NCGR_PEP_ID=MMETSP0098-20131031/4857_1 /ASSEMBLY_ACC=CAM_ASM_000208 /TAXON_ID=96639 /ORGANISM=" , Strain NY0313808BC1" /LENGTH=1766 /DNA_ID=CAMNT_0050640045 /DNA_START=30 /DNA_END=5327 /DNA_ORIENTATION=-